MLTGSKKRMFVTISMAVILLCGCGNTAYMAISETEKVQINEKPDNSYTIIEEEDVPLAPVPSISKEEPENAAEEVSEKADVQEEAVPEETEKPVETSQQPLPTREVEVFLQTEDVQMDIAVETEAMPVEENSFDAVSFTAEVLQAVNEERAQAGLPGFIVSQELSAAATKRATEISGNFSHTRPGGGEYETAITEAGGSYGYVGENLFSGMDTVTALEAAWNSSPVHLENILNGNFACIGIGVAETTDGVYVVQMFTD